MCIVGGSDLDAKEGMGCEYCALDTTGGMVGVVTVVL
jgi:hypothetical protein